MFVNKEKCLRCGGCVSVCPKNALELTEQGIIRDEKKCINCGICEKFCPVGAIKVKKEK
ncbi:MAG: ferredoxin [Candidatus Aenigmatarchaeota archaeon]|nr:MAG: ferredoxin [Candidatus Aenigmarchaeota archaeon]